MRHLTALHRRFRARTDLALQRLGSGDAGAVDLASIMVGILVLGVVAGIIVATVFGVIPWSQDNTASQDLDAIKTAESVFRAENTATGGPQYVIDFNGADPAATTLVSAGLIHRKMSVQVVTNNAGDAYIGISTSPTGNTYYLDSDATRTTRPAGTPIPAAVSSFASTHSIGLPYEPAPSGGITSMWAWQDPLTTAQDPRGQNDPAMTAANLAAYAVANNLSDIRVSVPWAASGGAYAAWLSDTATQLHAIHVNMQGVGGDPSWVSNPSLLQQWITDAHTGAPAIDGYDVDIEPWVGDTSWQTDQTKIGQYITMVTAGANTAHSFGKKISVDAPWWLANTTYGSGTALSAIAAVADEVNIITFEDTAATINSESQNAVTQTVAAGKAFYIGVTTESPAQANGAQFTFGDDGKTVLNTEVGKVRANYQSTTGYKGVAVQDYLSWRNLGS